MKIDILEIINIAKLAGEEILKIYSQDFEVFTKEDNSPLTIADKNANDIIISNLVELYPEIPFISEEMQLIPYNDRIKWEQCWMIDPLDGTKEFVKKNGEFTVNIALIKNGEPFLGVVYLPVFEELFYAIKGKGSFKIDYKTNQTKILKRNKKKTNKVKIIASRSHLTQEVLDFVAKIEKDDKETEFINAGSSLKFCLIAEGKADIYPRLAPTMEWDTAAAQIVCEEAGYSVKNYFKKTTLKYNKPNLLNPWFIVE